MFVFKFAGYALLLTCFMSELSAEASQGPVYQAQTGSNPLQNITNQNIQAKINLPNSNPFLEYYTRQNTQLFKDSSSFYFQSAGGKLIKKGINRADLEKAVVVFFGDWCPHCDAFLKSFSAHVDLLRLSGITTIFVGIPSIERLKNWKELTVDEFNAAENKIASYNITLSTKNTFVTMIGSKSVLTTCGIEGLPVFVVVKDGKEQCRFIGQKAVQKINMSDPVVLKQFLSIWDDEKITKSEPVEVKSDGDKSLISDESDGQVVSNTNQKTHKWEKARRNKTCKIPTNWKQSHRNKTCKTPTNWKKARELTEELNKFDCSKLRQPGLIFYD